MASRIVKIERLTLGPAEGNRTSQYFIRPGSVRRKWKFFELYEVPPFEGPSAWFEVERDGRAWRFIRQVDAPY